MVILGLDIGGANTKACWAQAEAGQVVKAGGSSVYHEVWRDPEGLRKVLAGLRNKAMNQLGGTSLGAAGLTMTAELCDVFSSRAQGVRQILSLAQAGFSDCPLYVWGLHGDFLTLDQALGSPLEVAAANWLASATMLARSCEDLRTGSGLLADMGSTTTDILPLAQGQVQVQGRTDRERMACGELVYTGVLRTPVHAIAKRVFIGGRPCPTTPEYFTIAADVYRLLGDIDEEGYACATPDGGPPSWEAAARRLARLVASEPEVLGEAGILALAGYIREKHIQQITEAIYQVISRSDWRFDKFPGLGVSPPLFMAGPGSFLLKEVARRLGWRPVPWWEAVAGDGIERESGEPLALTTYALVWLLAKKLKAW